MRGASRASYAILREQLGGPGLDSRIGDELFAVTGLLDAEHGLRRALSDPGKSAAEKAAVAHQLLRGKVSAATENLTAAATEQRWGSPSDLSDGIEELAIEATVAGATSKQQLDDLEDDLFRFSRRVAAEPDLRQALTGDVPADGKQSLVASLLRNKVSPVALALISQLVAHPRGRSLTASLDLAAGIAAKRREQLIATVRSVAPLTDAQQQRLATALQTAYGHEIHLNVVIDPTVVGGISVQIGDELIDGTAASQLAAVRRKLAS
jgi:F-type H+-transporting ATPase subunit delta